MIARCKREEFVRPGLRFKFPFGYATSSRSRSASSVGPVGCQPSFLRVCSLEAGHVVRGKHREPAEIGLRLFRRDGFDRQIQAPADGFGDIAHRHAFLGDRVIFRASFCLLDRQPVEAGGVEHVRRGPAIADRLRHRRTRLFREASRWQR